MKSIWSKGPCQAFSQQGVFWKCVSYCVCVLKVSLHENCTLSFEKIMIGNILGCPLFNIWLKAWATPILNYFSDHQQETRTLIYESKQPDVLLEFDNVLLKSRFLRVFILLLGSWIGRQMVKIGQDWNRLWKA